MKFPHVCWVLAQNTLYSLCLWSLFGSKLSVRDKVRHMTLNQTPRRGGATVSISHLLIQLLSNVSIWDGFQLAFCFQTRPLPASGNIPVLPYVNLRKTLPALFLSFFTCPFHHSRCEEFGTILLNLMGEVWKRKMGKNLFSRLFVKCSMLSYQPGEISESCNFSGHQGALSTKQGCLTSWLN